MEARFADFSLRASPRLRGCALALAVLATAGCAGAQRASGPEVVWPLPPEKPRVKHVRTFSGASDFETSGWSRFRRALVGGGGGAAVFNPAALALSADDRFLYVSNPGRGYVVVFDREEGTARDFGFEHGAGPARPYCLAVDGAGKLYVADTGNASVRVYRPDGKYVTELGRGLLERPMGIAIDDRRQVVYVVDGGTRASTRHLVEAFAPDGRHLRTIGKAGNGPGELFFPTNIAVAPDGNVYVSDTMNGRIQVFSPEGELVGMFGSLGTGLGEFGKSKGIAFDRFGNLHVVDSQNAVVQIFNAKFQLLMAYGGLGGSPALLQLPNGIAIDSKNNIFVADFAAHQVKQYQLINTSAQDSFAPESK